MVQDNEVGGSEALHGQRRDEEDGAQGGGELKFSRKVARPTRRRAVFAAAATIAVTLLASASGASLSSAASNNLRPCDIYSKGGTPCVASYSTTRALYAAYRGPLYELKRASDGSSQAIGVLSNGYADAASHTAFCKDTSCVFLKVYDQSENHNDLTLAPPSTYETGGILRTTPFNYVDAGALPTVLNGHSAYGMYFSNAQKTGMRNDFTSNVPVGAEPEGMYMVASGTHSSGALFDFGNMETNDTDDGAGTMDAVSLSTVCWFPYGTALPSLYGQVPPGSQCPTGPGPWVQADLENGVYMSGTDAKSPNPDYSGSTSPYVTAMLKNNGLNYFALKAANSQSGPLLTTYAGNLPPAPTPPNYNDLGGYSPMRKQGAIGLGTGGDGLSSGDGNFYEGVMTKGLPSDATENAVQANIVQAGYGQG